LPPPEDDGRCYLKIPLNAFDDVSQCRKGDPGGLLAVLGCTEEELKRFLDEIRTNRPVHWKVSLA
jgi:hypothetical protein